MPSMGDPVGSGLVRSLARPGGNSTGLSIMIAELGPKQLELLHATVPKAALFAVLGNPLNPGQRTALKTIHVAAAKLGIEVLPIEASNPQEIAGGFASMARQHAGALIVPQDSLFTTQRSEIVDLAAKHRLPLIGGSNENAAGGFLMSYGQNSRNNFRRAATLVDKIFKGANPGDLPGEQPTVFDLAINLKTAKALGIKIPQSVRLQATEVIE